MLDRIIAKVIEGKRPTAKQFGLFLAENRILAPLGKEGLGRAVCACLSKMPLAVRAGPSNPPDAATLDAFRDPLHIAVPQGETIGTGLLKSRVRCIALELSCHSLRMVRACELPHLFDRNERSCSNPTG